MEDSVSKSCFLLKGSGGAKKVLCFASKGLVEMLILMPIINYLCFYVFSNSNSNKKTHEKEKKKIKPHFTLNVWTYLPT